MMKRFVCADGAAARGAQGPHALNSSGVLERLQLESYRRLAWLPACAWTACVLCGCHILIHALVERIAWVPLCSTLIYGDTRSQGKEGMLDMNHWLHII